MLETLVNEYQNGRDAQKEEDHQQAYSAGTHLWSNRSKIVASVAINLKSSHKFLLAPVNHMLPLQFHSNKDFVLY